LKEKKLEEEAEMKLSKMSDRDGDYNEVVPRVGFSMEGVPLLNYKGMHYI
jgi:hypothetical protein